MSHTQTRIEHQNELLQQISHQKVHRELEKKRERDEFENTKVTILFKSITVVSCVMLQAAEKEYQLKLHNALSRPHPDHVHPKRLLRSGPF